MLNRLPQTFQATLFALWCLSTQHAAAVTTDSITRFKLAPGPVARGFLTPTGWGNKQPMMYAYIAGTFPQVYSHKSDLLSGIGAAWGDSCRPWSVRMALNVNDVSQCDQYSGNLALSIKLNAGSSITAGALHLWANRINTDASPSYYVALSRAVQRWRPRADGTARAAFTIGAGSGRFYTMSQRDEQLGRWKHGTIFFGSFTASISKTLVATVEWTGHNLCFSTNWRPYLPALFPFRLPSLSLGIADPLRTSGEHLRFVASLSYGYALPWPKQKCKP
jgi:hypothetical protein